jgi:hypothetical protein
MIMLFTALCRSVLGAMRTNSEHRSTIAIDPAAEVDEGQPVHRSIGEASGMGSSDILCPH